MYESVMVSHRYRSLRLGWKSISHDGWARLIYSNGTDGRVASQLDCTKETGAKIPLLSVSQATDVKSNKDLYRGTRNFEN